ncbi:hypothetical protein EC973_008627 [Apophysomyces ossiformis]|uniref:Mitochondrial import inner membrane translocase subunit TIM50 n=1 Tax=Apophysomyces ossiformis TaxID=679940 RepID=A0A8H7BNB0_9FUNG|nr:hypothetical protein EC973_008627 [Apophysomyces ossiformis]
MSDDTHSSPVTPPTTIRTEMQPNENYLALSAETSKTLTEAQKQLLVLDLNGTFVRRYNNQGMFVRPYSTEFFDFIFQNFTVMVWSSAQPRSVDMMCRMFGHHRSKLVRIWDRDKFSLTREQYYRKTQTIKDLSLVWDELSFNETNTIMLDDSPAKSVLQPYSSVHLAEFDYQSPEFQQYGDSELCAVMDYLNKLRYESNVASYIHKCPYIAADPKKTVRNSWLCVQHDFSNPYEQRIYDFKTGRYQTDSLTVDRWDRSERRREYHLAIQHGRNYELDIHDDYRVNSIRSHRWKEDRYHPEQEERRHRRDEMCHHRHRRHTANHEVDDRWHARSDRRVYWDETYNDSWDPSELYYSGNGRYHRSDRDRRRHWEEDRHYYHGRNETRYVFHQHDHRYHHRHPYRHDYSENNSRHRR